MKDQTAQGEIAQSNSMRCKNEHSDWSRLFSFFLWARHGFEGLNLVGLDVFSRWLEFAGKESMNMNLCKFAISKGLESGPSKSPPAQEHFMNFLNFHWIQA